MGAKNPAATWVAPAASGGDGAARRRRLLSGGGLGAPATTSPLKTNSTARRAPSGLQVAAMLLRPPPLKLSAARRRYWRASTISLLGQGAAARELPFAGAGPRRRPRRSGWFHRLGGLVCLRALRNSARDVSLTLGASARPLEAPRRTLGARFTRAARASPAKQLPLPLSQPSPQTAVLARKGSYATLSVDARPAPLPIKTPQAEGCVLPVRCCAATWIWAHRSPAPSASSVQGAQGGQADGPQDAHPPHRPNR